MVATDAWPIHAWTVACERFTCPPPGDSSTSHGGVDAGDRQAWTGLTLSRRLAGVIVLGAIATLSGALLAAARPVEQSRTLTSAAVELNRHQAPWR